MHLKRQVLRQEEERDVADASLANPAASPANLRERDLDAAPDAEDANAPDAAPDAEDANAPDAAESLAESLAESPAESPAAAALPDAAPADAADAKLNSCFIKF